jgi:hypothetical protein
MKSPLFRIGLATLLVGLATPSLAESQFRGFSLSNTPEQVDAIAKQQNFTVKWEDAFYTLDDKTDKDVSLIYDDDTCASILFSGDGKIKKMTFYVCFFAGEGMTLRQVTQEFVDRYGGNADIDPYPDHVCKIYSSFEYRGRTKEGEQFEIKEDCAVIVEITPGKQLKF